MNAKDRQRTAREILDVPVQFLHYPCTRAVQAISTVSLKRYATFCNILRPCQMFPRDNMGRPRQSITRRLQ